MFEKINEVLKNDGVIAYVTDTVWGLGCLPTSEKAVKKIYEIKHRDGKITYEEYMEYCRKQSENPTNQEISPKAEAVKTENPDTKEEQIVVKDYAKAFKSYTNSEPKAESKIEDEA